jgi:prepilin-type N-terminal cleavage/methylation domain-containing protein
MPNNLSTPRSQNVVPHGARGFNLIELLMAMSIAAVIFMAITVLYTYQAKTLRAQTSVLTMHREIRFGIDHLRRDLSSLGSNTTPNSVMDDRVCPKPITPIRVITAELGKGFVYNAGSNPNIQSVALTLFGSLDVRSRYRVESITGAKVVLQTDGAPATEEIWTQIFATDRFLRLSSAEGNSFFYPISGSAFSDRSVTLTVAPPQISGTQRCGYLATGYGMWVDVQGFVRYRVVSDTRPGAPEDDKGKPMRGLLVRERLAIDGITLVSQTALAENTVELAIADAAFDIDPNESSVKLKNYPLQDHPELLTKGGGGLLGVSGAAKPESLRFMSVKLSLRAEIPDRDLTHQQRVALHRPLHTYRLDNDRRTTCRVVTMGTRVTMPTMVARNL